MHKLPARVRGRAKSDSKNQGVVNLWGGQTLWGSLSDRTEDTLPGDFDGTRTTDLKMIYADNQLLLSTLSIKHEWKLSLPAIPSR